MSEITPHLEIMRQLGVLEGKIDGIITRQDFANGRTSKLEQKVETLQKQQDKSDGRLSVYGWVFTAIIAIGGIATGIISLFKK